MSDDRKPFVIFIDGTQFTVHMDQLSGAQIMELGGISVDAGLILIEEDGTQLQVRPADVIELKPGHRFKKAPRFVRGATSD